MRSCSVLLGLALMAMLTASSVLGQTVDEDINTPHPPYHAEVSIHVDQWRTIQSGTFVLDQLDRQRYFRCYHPLGAFSEARNRELDNIGATPGRGTMWFDLAVDPNRPGQPTEESLRQSLHFGYDAFRRARQTHPDLLCAMANGSYPRWMRLALNPAVAATRSATGKLQEDWELVSQHNILDPRFYAQYAGYVSQWYGGIQAAGGYPPTYVTVQNEPVPEWKPADLAAYTRILAARLHQDHPGVKVAGPCSAWPYPNSDWRRWNYERTFIEQAGNVLDAYDMHFYSKAHWALPPTPEWQKQRVREPSMFVNQYMGNATVWDFGRLDAYLDLFAASHMEIHHTDSPKPIIISEFGNQTLHPQFGPWTNEFKPWLYMTTVARMWMTFLEHPEVQLTIPFILGESDPGYAPARGMAVYNRPGAPTDLSLHVTRFRDFYLFFRDLSGRRISADVAGDPGADRDLLVTAFRDGRDVSVLLHNRRGFPYYPCVLDLKPLLGRDADGGVPAISSMQIKRLYYSGEIPEPHDKPNLNGTLHIDTNFQPLPRLDRVELHPEEFVLVRVELTTLPRATAIHETWHYAKSTVLDIRPGEAQRFEIELPSSVLSARGARLLIGLARDGGFAVDPLVAVNQTPTGPVDLRYSRGIRDFHGLAQATVRTESLRAGRNEITITFPPDMPRDGYPKIVSVKLVTTAAEAG